MFGGTNVRFVLECETCGSDVHLVVLVLEHDHAGDPVIRPDFVLSQESFYCDLCGGVTYTGDFDEILYHEPGEETDDEDNYEEEEEQWYTGPGSDILD